LRYNNLKLQEAQLSQRDRAMLGVIEYFAVTQGHSRSFKTILEKGASLYYCNYVCILHHFGYIQH